jgi:hypothetical protein
MEFILSSTNVELILESWSASVATHTTISAYLTASESCHDRRVLHEFQRAYLRQ